MRRVSKLLFLSSAGLAAAGAARADTAVATAGRTVDELVVSAAARQPSAAATGLPLTLRETPQSITVVNPGQIRDFGLTDANRLLAQVPGVNVEQVETDRTYYNARGFDITNFQIDAVGLPLIWGIQFGGLDTVIFDRVEVVKGANSVMTGIGNPSATVNYVRKRPTATLQGDLAVEAGSWNHKRIEADVSGPLNAAGTLRGRLVAAGESGDSWLDRYATRRQVLYGALAWDATDRLTLTAGYSRQDSRDRGNLWGALPLVYSDGTRIDYPVSATTSADWTHWNVLDQTAFVEAAYALPADWNLKATATYRSFDEDAQLLYAYGNPDPATGLGVGGMSGLYPSKYRQYLFDVTASGPFRLFGREHQLAVGASAARGVGKEWEGFSADLIAYPPVGLWSARQVAEPTYPDPSVQADIVDKLYRAYASARLSFTDRLSAVVGASAVKLQSSGVSYGADETRDDSKLSPYAGVIFDLTPQVSLYASYTDIFNPQVEVDASHRRLDAAHGRSYEAGVKAELFERRLYATAAVFKAEQLGLAEAAGVFPDSGKTYYRGVDTKVTGFELEAAGRITDRLTLSGGYTDLDIDGQDGGATRTFIPGRTFKVASTWTAPQLRNLKLGAALRWQDKITAQDIVLVKQGAYAELDLMAAVDVTDQVRATLNLRNVADSKHLTSLMWNQAYYAAPRSVSVRLDYAF
jgi:outer membrane receptor for ferric coprogen and ferric-rhodotorulic acid